MGALLRENPVATRLSMALLPIMTPTDPADHEEARAATAASPVTRRTFRPMSVRADVPRGSGAKDGWPEPTIQQQQPPVTPAQPS
jgi:hypothetical protein